VGDTLKLQGREGVGIETWGDEIALNTGVLGKPDTRRLRAPVLGLSDGSRPPRDEVKYTDLDGVQGGSWLWLARAQPGVLRHSLCVAIAHRGSTNLVGYNRM